MSRYLERIQTILKNADSKKITDKKVCIRMKTCYDMLRMIYFLCY